jgi:predicted nucleic acid-binding protein
VIYLDTSVLLAEILVEDERPPPAFWQLPRISSRLLEYETMVRMQAYRLGQQYLDLARDLLNETALLELTPQVLERALAPFAKPVRTLDALHLASLHYLREARAQDITLATYDDRLRAAAVALGVSLYDLRS